MNSNKFKAIKASVLISLCFIIISGAVYLLPPNNYIALRGAIAQSCSSIIVNGSETHPIHNEQELFRGNIVLFLKSAPKTIEATCTKDLQSGDVTSVDGTEKYDLEVISKNSGNVLYKIIGEYNNTIKRNVFKSLVLGLYFIAFVLGPIFLIIGSRDKKAYALIFVLSAMVRFFGAYAVLPGIYDYDAQFSHMNGYLGVDDNWFGNHYSLLWIGVLQLLDSKLSMTILQVLVSSTGILVLYDYAKHSFKAGRAFVVLFLLFIVLNPLIVIQDLYISRDIIYGWGLCILAVYLTHKHYSTTQAICFAVVVALTVNLRRETVGVVIVAVLLNLLLTRRLVPKGVGKNIIVAAVMSVVIALIGTNEYEGNISRRKMLISIFHYSAELMWNKQVVSLGEDDRNFVEKYIDLETAKKQRELYQPNSAIGTFRDELWGIDNKSYTRLISIFIKQIVTSPVAFIKLRTEQYLGSFNVARTPPDNFVPNEYSYAVVSKKQKNQVELSDHNKYSVSELRTKIYKLSRVAARTFPYIFVPLVLCMFVSLYFLPGIRMMTYIVLSHEAILFFLSPMSSMKYHYSFVLAALVVAALMLSSQQFTWRNIFNKREVRH
tara:strand:+ start:3421 stop:5232 length:1812 start_codon:yes stop_codon:yes gene_type:complete